MSDIAVSDTGPDPMAAPQPFYRMMRDSMPVLEITDGPRQGTIVCTHADVQTVLRTPAVFSSGAEAVQIGQIRPLIPLQIDPPQHVSFRKILDPLFAPRRIAPLEGRVRALVTEMIDAVIADGTGNFHSSIAEPLPTTVFLELLGLPVSRRDEFIALKDGIIRPVVTTPEERLNAVNASGAEIYRVLEDVVAAREQERRDDFLSGFLDAEVEGHRLTHDDVIDIGYLFFLAGLDTVTASLDCMIAYLAQHHEQRQELVDDPTLIPAAIEELLRWETPVAGVARITTQATELSGCPISAGQPVHVLIGSANTDERVWDEPDRVDFHRPSNPHLAFGGGVHRCLGSHLARMELRVVLEEWHRRVPEYHLATTEPLIYSEGLRQVENLHLAW